MKKKGYTNEMNNKFVNLKKSFLLIAALGLFAMSSYANPYRSQQSELTISMWERSAEFLVVMNGFKKQGQGAMTLDRVNPGNHYIQVFQLHRSRCSNERGKTLVHEGRINIPKLSRMTAIVNPRMGLRVVQVQPLAMLDSHQGHSHDNHNGHYDNYGQYENTGYQGQYDDYHHECHGCNTGCTACRPVVAQCGTVEPVYPNHANDCDVNADVPTQGHDLYTQYMIDNGMYNDNSSSMPSGYYGSYMTDYELNHLVKELEDAWFDSDRIKIAKRRIKAKKVSSAQVLEIIQQMSFESSRLEVAKYAYAYTIDQDNYYEVNNGFEFTSSINTLEESIGY